MGTTKKLSGKTMGYVILIGLVIVSWAIFKILTPHNFGSFFQYAQLLSGQSDCHCWCGWFLFRMVMGMFDFSIGANIMLSAIVGCVFGNKIQLRIFRTDRRRYSYRYNRWFIKRNFLCKIKNSIYDRYNRSGTYL